MILLLLTLLMAPVPKDTAGERATIEVWLYDLSEIDLIKGTKKYSHLNVFEDNKPFKENDRIIEVGSVKVYTRKELDEVLKSYKPRDRIDVVVLRGPNLVRLTVTLGAK